MKSVNKTLIGAAVGASFVAFSVASASASIVCAGPGSLFLKEFAQG
jgi:hypothetical protein